MNHTNIFIKTLYTSIFSLSAFLTSLCCDSTLSTPTERGRCEELIRENEKLQKDLVNKYELVSTTAPQEKLAEEQKKVAQESEHLERDYAKRIQELQQN